MHMGILLIEDDGSTSDILKLALEAAGFKVDIARSAKMVLSLHHSGIMI